MIQVKTVKQTIQLRGNIAPRLTIQNAPAQTIKLSSSGPRGPRGEQGLPGPVGPIANLNDLDLPDFTLIFDNKLI